MHYEDDGQTDLEKYAAWAEANPIEDMERKFRMEASIARIKAQRTEEEKRLRRGSLDFIWEGGE